MKKRLTALFLALCLVMSVATLPVSASDLGKDVLGAYAEHYGQIGAYWVYLSDYLEGKMSYDAFKLKTEALIYDIDEGNGPISGIFSGICESLEGFNYGITTITADTVEVVLQALTGLDDVFGNGGYFDNLFYTLWDKFCNSNGYTTSDVDMKGYGAVLKVYNNEGKLSYIYYGEYGIFNRKSSNCISFAIKNCHYYEYGYSYDDVQSRTDYEKDLGIGAWYYYDGRYEFIGDWRNEINDDDTLLNDLLTDPGESSLSPDDLPEDTDLTDFLKDLLEKLMNAFPDTSTIEGLLRAILAKCTSIDERIAEQGGGMTASELNTMLDEAILKITLQNQVNDTAMLNELINIRKILQGFDDDEVIDDDTSNSILEGLISGITSGLINFIGINADVSDLVDACKDAGTLGIKLLSGIVDIIAFLSAAVPYNIIKTLLTSVFGIMFNESTPVDLTFTIDSTSYTLLSTSFLNIPVVAGALNILKGVVTVIIVFSWLKWARKFYLSLL